MTDLRGDLLAEAAKIVAVDRNSNYGEPEDSFGDIAALWNAQGYTFTKAGGSRPLTGSDVALMMTSMKLARLKNNPTHRDSWVDIAGYAACGYEVGQRMLDRAQIDRGEDIP